MKALILNSGSSTLKWSVLEGEKTLAAGTESWSAEASGQIRARLEKVPAFDAVGHRFVHGGTLYRESVKLDPEVRKKLEGLRAFDELHLGPELAGIDAIAEIFPAKPQVVAFDTTFHTTMPAAARGYGLPFEWSERWGLERFGFHGLSVAWSVERVRKLAGHLPERLIVCHLGSGCSVTAMRAGRSVDTSMGFTPLEGLVMSTRPGTVDAGLILHLIRQRGLSTDEILETLEKKSGLLGLSGVSKDLREVVKAADTGNPRAQLAYDRFLLSLRRAVGSAAGVLGGVDAVVFTGGIGENSERVRRDSAEALGVRLADGATPEDQEISSGTPRAFVVHAREDVIVFREIERLLR